MALLYRQIMAHPINTSSVLAAHGTSLLIPLLYTQNMAHHLMPLLYRRNMAHPIYTATV